jgi:hypothetical protein
MGTSETYIVVPWRMAQYSLQIITNVSQENIDSIFMVDKYGSVFLRNIRKILPGYMVS